MFDERSRTVVQQCVWGRDVKQWRCWMNGHEHWFSNGYGEETWNNDDVGWTVTNSGSAMCMGKRRETMTMLDERSWTLVQQWVWGRDMKQWRCWVNGHEQWFSNVYGEETWNNDDVGWTVMNIGSAMGMGKRRETMMMLDERSRTVVHQWVWGRDVKQWRCWMNGHEHSQPWL